MHSLRVIQASRQDGRRTRQTKMIKYSLMTSTSITIVHIDRSLLCAKKAITKYTRTFELYYAVSFAEAYISDAVNDVMPSQNLHKQLRSSSIRYVKIGPLMTNNAHVLPLRKSLNEG